MLHLKRFSSSRWGRAKIDDLVVFPVENFDLRRYLSDGDGADVLYDLVGVVNHYGGLGSGHYTAFTLNPFNGDWFKYDDSLVTTIQKCDIVTSAAYILIYSKKGGKDLNMQECLEICNEKMNLMKDIDLTQEVAEEIAQNLKYFHEAPRLEIQELSMLEE